MGVPAMPSPAVPKSIELMILLLMDTIQDSPLNLLSMVLDLMKDCSNAEECFNQLT